MASPFFKKARGECSFGAASYALFGAAAEGNYSPSRLNSKAKTLVEPAYSASTDFGKQRRHSKKPVTPVEKNKSPSPKTNRTPDPNPQLSPLKRSSRLVHSAHPGARFRAFASLSREPRKIKKRSTSSRQSKVRLEIPHFDPLIIERQGTKVIVAHYFKMNGDSVPDPDMEFQVNSKEKWIPSALDNQFGYKRVFQFEDDKLLWNKHEYHDQLSFSDFLGKEHFGPGI
jgi:hypothetical protein